MAKDSLTLQINRCKELVLMRYKRRLNQANTNKRTKTMGLDIVKSKDSQPSNRSLSLAKQTLEFYKMFKKE